MVFDGNAVNDAAFAHRIDLLPTRFRPVERLTGFAEQLSTRGVGDVVLIHDRAPQRRAVLAERTRRSSLGVDQLQLCCHVQCSTLRSITASVVFTAAMGLWGGYPALSLAGQGLLSSGRELRLLIRLADFVGGL